MSVGGEGRKRGRSGRTALMVDSKEVIETFNDEKLNERKGGCEYPVLEECDALTEDLRRHPRHMQCSGRKESTCLGDWIIEDNTFYVLLGLQGRCSERMLFASLLIYSPNNLFT